MATPAEVLDRSGRRLAHRLGPQWQWLRSRHAVVRREGTRTDLIELEPATRSRSGIGTWAYLRVSVRDTALGRWRKEQGDQVLQVGDLVWTSPFINVDRSLYFIELEGPLHRSDSRSVHHVLLGELERRLPNEVVPQVDLFRSPAAVAEQLPDSWLVFPGPTIEWAGWSGDEGAARRLAARALARLNEQEHRLYVQARAAAIAGDHPPFPLGPAGVGWVAGRLDAERGA